MTEQTVNPNPSEANPVKRGPFGRPLKTQPEAPAVAAAPKTGVVQEALGSVGRLMRAAMTRGQKQPIDPATLKKLRDERAALLNARLEAHNDGRDHIPEDMVKQYKFEAIAIANGSWFPGMKRPRGAIATDAEQIMGVPGAIPTPAEKAKEDAVDAILES